MLRHDAGDTIPLTARSAAGSIVQLSVIFMTVTAVTSGSAEGISGQQFSRQEVAQLQARIAELEEEVAELRALAYPRTLPSECYRATSSQTHLSSLSAPRTRTKNNP